jgi:hypothetical protein
MKMAPKESACSIKPRGTAKPASLIGTSGHQPSGGIFITSNMNTAGGGSATDPLYVTGVTFSRSDPTKLYSFGSTAGPLGETSYTFDTATGMFTAGSVGVDFQYALPSHNASAWATSHSYGFGDYVIHPLTAPEMATGGVWAAGTSYQVGDIVVSGGAGAGNCMYKVSSITTGISGGTSPAFDTTAPCGHEALTDSGVTWGGTNSTAQFIYQNTGAAGTSKGTSFQWIATPTTLATDGAIASTTGRAVLTSASNPFLASQVGQTISVSGAGSGGTTPLYTTVLSFQSAGQVTLAQPALHTTSGATVALTGHPDILSNTVSDSNGLVWTNVGTAYVPSSPSQVSAAGGPSKDDSKWVAQISTNSYGFAPRYLGVQQGTGIWVTEYDVATDIFHLLNTITGIWTDWACSSGSGYACPRTATTVGALTTITNNPAVGQECPFYLHGAGPAKNGSYITIGANPRVYAACSTTYMNQLFWITDTEFFDTATSLQSSYGGLNHFDLGMSKMIAFTGGGAYGYDSGVFTTIYSDMSSMAGPLSKLIFGTFLQPLASQSTPQTVPPGCYVTVGGVMKNPDCNLGEILDSHLSWVGDPGTDNYPACGTTYNLPTLGPAFNAWQNMETCYPTAVTQSVSSLPISSSLPSFGSPWQFTHTFATGTSRMFSTQYQLSQYSQDGNWLFWSSDWNCQNGSLTGSPPTVWTSDTHVQMLAVAAVPANPSSLCGLPWIPATTYVVGNTINPIEGTSGSGQVDDVFQAIYVNGASGPASTLAGKQPKCGTTSCFANTTPPTSSVAGGTVCDSTSGTANSINPSLPYSTSCPNGVVWQDLGVQTQRGDVFAVKLGNLR